jgi:nucleoside-diphosphate-sugar epimerase
MIFRRTNRNLFATLRWRATRSGAQSTATHRLTDEPEPFTEAGWAAKAGAIPGWSGRMIAVQTQQTPAHLVELGNFEQHLFMDSSRIRAELGYTEPVSLDEALRRTIEWERASPPAEVDPAKVD